MEQLRSRRPFACRAAILCLAVLCALPLCPPGVRSAPLTVQAPGRPGAQPLWNMGRKDGVGSAFGRISTVWYTLADGMLTEVFYPTTDTPDVSSLSFIVTDGHSFVDQQRLNMLSSSVQRPDPQVPLYEVTSLDRHGHYRIIADYLSDPAQPTVLIHLRLLLPTGNAPAPYRLYVRYDPTLNGDGTKDIGSVAGGALLAHSDKGHYGPIATALLANPALREGTVGFVGTVSDPSQAFNGGFSLGTRYTSAGPGNIVEAARVPLRADGEAALALGFGPGMADAQAAAAATLARPYDALASDFAAGWHGYAATLLRPGNGFTAEQSAEFYAAATTLKASEDKRYPGAIVASLSFPWGQVAATYAGHGYHLVWTRDLYEMVSALAAAGDTATARDATHYMLHTLELLDGGMPQTSLVDGTPTSGARQMDQVAYPLLLAYDLGMDDAATYTGYLRPLADYLARHGPITGQERWEEDSGYSPSTIAAEIAGLVAAGSIAEKNGDGVRAIAYRAIADFWQRTVKQWTVTSTGALASHPYFIRLDDNLVPNDGDPIDISGGPAVDERNVVDAGFLELVRLGELAPTDPAVVQSLPVIDATIGVQSPFGLTWRRYNGDTYGDGANGTAWNIHMRGIGNPWPVFDGERGEYLLALGQTEQATAYLETMRRFASPTGMIPEQVWPHRPIAPTPPGAPLNQASIGMQPWQAAGSANPLNWAMGQYVRLLADLQAGTLTEQPGITRDRYVTHPVGAAQLTVSTPAGDISGFTGSTLAVQGRTTPGAEVVILVNGVSGGTVSRPTVGADGSFRATVAIPNAYAVRVNIAVQDTTGRTALVLRTLSQ